MGSIKVKITEESFLSKGLCIVSGIVYATVSTFFMVNSKIEPESFSSAGLVEEAIRTNSYFVEVDSGDIYINIRTLNKHYGNK